MEILGGVHDYELGLSSTAGSPAPDILAFRSTKQHSHIHLPHADVPDGTEFYIMIKTTSKAKVEGIQVTNTIKTGYTIYIFIYIEFL